MSTSRTCQRLQRDCTKKKLRTLHGVENVEKGDPFLISSECVDDVSKWPEVEFGQIYVYVIDSPGPYTRETMKAYSSLEAYQQFSTAV